MQFWPPILVHPLPKLKFKPNGVGNPRFRVWIHVNKIAGMPSSIGKTGKNRKNWIVGSRHAATQKCRVSFSSVTSVSW